MRATAPKRRGPPRARIAPAATALTRPGPGTRRDPGDAMPDDRLIVGLDLPDAAAARAMVAALGDAVGFYKIGLGLLAPAASSSRPSSRPRGKRVFLDMKLFDIGATVTAAARPSAASRRTS